MEYQQGRQGTGYLKKKLLEWKFFDLYILKYPEGSQIPPHKDPVPGKRHYRVNLELKKAVLGGKFKAQSTILNFGRLAIFRSDISEHEVTKILAGERIVLSFGLAL